MKKWQIKTADKSAVDNLVKETGISPFICKILVSRGILNRADAEIFFNSDELSDPYLLADMEKAVEVINEFVENGEKITVFGDYDCDGITSTFMLYDYLTALGAEVDWYIPSRDEGYGLNNNAIDLLHKRGTKLIITVDNGISAVEEAKHIAELGMTLVITDHHQVPETIPEAAAVVDPHRKDDMSVFRQIAGCGVVLKLISALAEDNETALMEYAPYAALGTIADIVPLVSENRIIVRSGIEAMQYAENQGLYNLIKKSGIDLEKDLSATQFAFYVCPRINAAGRCTHPKEAMELLLAENGNVAKAKAESLSSLNDKRKEMEDEIISAAEAQIKANPDLLNKKILIVYGEGWSHGIIGLASSKLLHKYGKPNIVITVEGDTARGSARSFEGLSLFKLLTACQDRLIRYGGHTKAAGLTLKTSEIEAFMEEAYAYCEDKEPALETITADMEVDPEELTLSNIELLSKLEPFGEENPQPLFLFRSCKIKNKHSRKDGKFTAIDFIYNNGIYGAISFSMPFDECFYEIGDDVDIIGSIEINEYNGTRKLSIRIDDMRYSDFNQDRYFAAKAAYEDYRCGKTDPRLLCRMTPTTDELKKCYDILRKTNSLSRAAAIASKENINYCKLLIMLDIFEEFGLIEKDITTGKIALIKGAPKADLSKSAILANLNSK